MQAIDRAGQTACSEVVVSFWLSEPGRRAKGFDHPSALCMVLALCMYRV